MKNKLWKSLFSKLNSFPANKLKIHKTRLKAEASCALKIWVINQTVDKHCSYYSILFQFWYKIKILQYLLFYISSNYIMQNKTNASLRSISSMKQKYLSLSALNTHKVVFPWVNNIKSSILISCFLFQLQWPCAWIGRKIGRLVKLNTTCPNSP